MGDIKEFTNEERSLLKFQKKQQHGQGSVIVLLVCSVRVILFVLFLLVVLRLIG